MTVTFACSPPRKCDFPSPTSSISSTSLHIPESSIIIRMPPVPGARGSFRCSSPVHIDSSDGGLDIDEFGRWNPFPNGPFSGEHAQTCIEFEPPGPSVLEPSTDNASDRSPQTALMRGLYFVSASASSPAEGSDRFPFLRVSLPNWHHPPPRSNDIPLDLIRAIEQPGSPIEQPISPSHLFVRYPFPHPKEPPMPTHYKFLDRNRMGDMDDRGAFSSPLRSQIMTQPPVPNPTIEDIQFATEQSTACVQELIWNSAERIKIEKMADQGEIDWRIPVQRRVRSSSMSNISNLSRMA